MKVNIGGVIYTLEVNNYFGPAYSYQSRTGEAIDFETEVDARLKFLMGALILCNDNFTMTFKEMISNFDDESIGKALAYLNERIAAIFADKVTPNSVKPEEGKEGEEAEQGED